MKAFRLTLIATTIFAGIVGNAFARSEIDENREIGKVEKFFMVEYDTGAKIQHVAIYTASVHYTRHESGDPSTWNHPIDNRQCHWSITPTVLRQTFAIMPDGERAEKKDTVEVYKIPFTNKGSDFVLSKLQSENCNSANDRVQSDLNNGIAAANRELQNLPDQDISKVLQIYSQKPKVVKVYK